MLAQNHHCKKYNIVRAKKLSSSTQKRSESYANMEEMYNEVYNSLVITDCAVVHEEAVWRDISGICCY